MTHSSVDDDRELGGGHPEPSADMAHDPKGEGDENDE